MFVPDAKRSIRLQANSITGKGVRSCLGATLSARSMIAAAVANEIGEEAGGIGATGERDKSTFAGGLRHMISLGSAGCRRDHG
jgi:hypothetical protein